MKFSELSSRKVHIIGINGIGMSALAIYLKKNNIDITGSDIRLGGFVTGNVQSNGQVVLGKKSKLQGDIVYRKLLIEDGAKFEGKCDLIDIEEKT